LNEIFGEMNEGGGILNGTLGKEKSLPNWKAS